MDFDVSPEETAFRAEVRAFLDAHAPARSEGNLFETTVFFTDHDQEMQYVQYCRDWQRVKWDQGWAGVSWPKEYGGRGGTPIEEDLFRLEESNRLSAWISNTLGIRMAGPAILAHGTEEQKRRFIPAMLEGEEAWCQLFSEPEAGSDLASLRTVAVPDGDEFVITGQKVWSSRAHFCDWGLLLARTDAEVPKHRGITAFLIDMKSPGVTVRPLVQLNGGAHFNETFLDEVRVPAANVLGGVNKGWAVAHTTLSAERSVIGVVRGDVSFGDILGLARATGNTDDPLIRQRLAAAYIRFRLLDFASYRVQTAAEQGREPGPESSVIKLALSQHLSLNGDLVMAMAGAGGMLGEADAVDGGRWHREFLTQWAPKIGGGTDQMQRNTIGERVLGLPSEPRVDKDVPFREAAKSSVRK
jgi:alkylation response protein AidB-like acyl-CoA dehydrogenase